MTSTSGRPGLRPRLWVDFSMRDTLACFQGDSHVRSEDGLQTEPGRSLLLNSGRASLHVLLESLSLPAGSKVGVPLFVCEAVFEAVVRAGCKPVFLDVDPETMILPASQTDWQDAVAALVAVHLFGNPVDVQTLSDGRSIPVIEDCAHALFSTMRGRRVGTQGIGAIYSFGLGKPISIGRLGAAIAVGKEAAKSLGRAVGETPPETWGERASRGIQSGAISALYRQPWYGMFAYELGRTFERTLDPMTHNVREYTAADVRLWGLVVSKLSSYRSRVHIQQDAWKVLADAVIDGSGNEITPQITEAGGTSDQWALAMSCGSRDRRDALARALLGVEIDSINMYDGVPECASRRFGYRGGAPVAERLSKTVLAIPVLTGNRADSVERVAGRLSDAVRTVVR